MDKTHQRKYWIISASVHLLIFILLVFGLDFTTPLPVFENTNKNDVISAVVLGDSPNSKILPQQQPLPKPLPPVVKPAPKIEPKPEPKPSVSVKEAVEKDVIALKVADKKKLADQKALEEKKRQELLTKDLLADIKKVNDKQKKIKQQQLKSEFEKMLHDQAEKSLRQQLLNEAIKVQGTQSRQAQGEVNKYKALIMQAISEHWIVPPQVDKKRYCELLIRVAPGGMVLDVQVTKSSGDPALDSSARAAVFKSSPLPVPQQADAFEAFRQFVLKVKPENVI